MSLIFVGSTDALSASNTSRFLSPFLNWLFPSIEPGTIEGLRFGIRKCGHLAEYAFFAFLALRGFQRPVRIFDAPKSPYLLHAWILSVLCAITDEFHQSLVPSRQGQLLDVIIDTSGAALGLLAYKWAHQYWGRKKG